MITDKKIANAVSGKTARACDCCIKKRARWYCPADDAFLCQSCDGSVHSANSLARRHERVRLKTASLNPFNDHQQSDLPSWHRGLTRKPRTPRRQGKNQTKSEERTSFHIIVPELSMEDTTSSPDGDTEEQLLYRVPIFDPFVTELRSSPADYEYEDTRTMEQERASDVGNAMFDLQTLSHPDEYMPSDLEEFAADVETLLGKGLDDESYGIEELGLLDCSPGIMDDKSNDNCSDKFVKEEVEILRCEGDMIRNRRIELDVNDSMVVYKEPFEMALNYDENDHKEMVMIEQTSLAKELYNLNNDEQKVSKHEVVLERRKILLSLDYEAISAAWASQGSPWMNGQRPEINLNDCWPQCMGICGHEGRPQLYGDNQMLIGGIIGDGGREARVSRYREKRRTRLFSKKIRYEVRKLNAEKRPRMKGRFVKRSSFVAPTTAFPLVPKK